MRWEKVTGLLVLMVLITMITISCSKSASLTQDTTQQEATLGELYSYSDKIRRSEDWTEETHGKYAEPTYDIVFPRDRVNQIKITISADNWGQMQANMIELFDEKGEQSHSAVPDDVAANIPQTDNVSPGTGNFPDGDSAHAPANGAQAERGRGDLTAENPTWVPATIEFNNLTWTAVGVRYKGNSSLKSGWNSGTMKLPLKLDFDEFEEEYPQIDNQRFYGFEQLSLSNSFSDGTYMCDMITSDLLIKAGLPAAQTAHYEIIIDYGEGPVNLGIYVMIEVIDDTAIRRYFGSDSGNIYEGEGPGASMAEDTFNQIENDFSKENNKEEADWSDIKALHSTLHSEMRTTNPEAWRERLESIFDVNAFLEWLAISAIIEHWDSYGAMPHNFYLYHDPGTDMLTWISWDHNMVLEGNDRLDRRNSRNWHGSRRSTSLDREQIDKKWPLIRYLLDDPVYYDLYISYLEETANNIFNPEELERKCRGIAALVGPYTTKEPSENNYESSVQQLINRIYQRYQTTIDFLATGGE
jgi:spore coat protein H